MIKNLGKLLFVYFATIFSLFASSAAENNSVKAEKELTQLKSDISSLQKKLNLKQKRQSKTIIQLRDSEKKIATTAKMLRATKNQIQKKEKKINQLNKQKIKLRSNKQKQKAALSAQIRSAFLNGQQEYGKLILNQEDPEAVSRMLTYYDYINKSRTKKIISLRKTINALNHVNQAIKTEIRKLQILKQTILSENTHYKKLTKQRKNLVNQLNREITAATSHLAELKTNAKALQKLIDSVQFVINNNEFMQSLDGLSPKNGKMQWPAKGKTIQPYGSQLASGVKSNGIVIKSPEGNPVSAIHHGRVVYADWLRGFGLLLIIDHGRGYMSLYGYNQSLYKAVGDWVESGEYIATIGKSGGKQLAALYFELRHNGKPLNPKKWFN